MSKKSNFTPSEPFVPKKRVSAPAPRSARIFAWTILGIVVALLVILAVVSFRETFPPNPDSLSDTQVLGYLDEYTQQDMVNLDQFLVDRGYVPTGENPDFLYECGRNKILIRFDRDINSVSVSDTVGNSRPYGLPPESSEFQDDGSTRILVYTCRLAWIYERDSAGQLIENPGMCDILIGRDALAHIVRLALR